MGHVIPRRYRDTASAVIDEVVRKVGLQSRPVLMKALKAAYPFETRDGWAYRVWLQEVKARTGGFAPRRPKNQLDLFDPTAGQ